jgi:hypothetical protein
MVVRSRELHAEMLPVVVRVRVIAVEEAPELELTT